jgi:hypothetical protein
LYNKLQATTTPHIREVSTTNPQSTIGTNATNTADFITHGCRDSFKLT